MMKIFYFIVISLFIVSCGSPAPEPTATIEPTATLEPTAIPKPTATPKPTAKPEHNCDY